MQANGNKNKHGTRRPSRNSKHRAEIRVETFREISVPGTRQESAGDTGMDG